MVRDISLIRYLPPFIAEYKEMQEIMNSENPEFILVAKEFERLLDDQFIITCDEVGIARFEDILGITPTSEDTLESRISRVLIRWNDVIPYTWKVFLEKIHTLCGDRFQINPNFDQYEMQIITFLDVYGQIDELERIIGYMIPANIKITAENVMNYDLQGQLYISSGIAFIDDFTLTDAFKVQWTVSGNTYAGVTASGTCEIEITDSFKGGFDIQSEAGGFVGMNTTEQIELSDTAKDTIQLSSEANTGNAITYTEII